MDTTIYVILLRYYEERRSHEIDFYLVGRSDIVVARVTQFYCTYV